MTGLPACTAMTMTSLLCGMRVFRLAWWFSATSSVARSPHCAAMVAKGPSIRLSNNSAAPHVGPPLKPRPEIWIDGSPLRILLHLRDDPIARFAVDTRQSSLAIHQGAIVQQTIDHRGLSGVGCDDECGLPPTGGVRQIHGVQLLTHLRQLAVDHVVDQRVDRGWPVESAICREQARPVGLNRTNQGQ